MQIKSQFKAHVNISGKTLVHFLKNVRIFLFLSPFFLVFLHFFNQQIMTGKLDSLNSVRCF